MIVAFSTSSPLSSVALLSPDGDLIDHREKLAPRAASEACLSMLDEMLKANDRRLSEATLFAADLGPGSFTGVKVGVTLAKVMALCQGVQAAGATSFDLFGDPEVVVVSAKKGEYLVRRRGSAPYPTEELPRDGCIGYGTGINPTYPSARHFATQVANLARQDPERLIPWYLTEPSISFPKSPFAGTNTSVK